ncbi:MAG: Do family serine endopeptidase [Candidatus Zhuqueibacterota bacterium]
MGKRKTFIIGFIIVVSLGLVSLLLFDDANLPQTLTANRDWQHEVASAGFYQPGQHIQDDIFDSGMSFSKVAKSVVPTVVSISSTMMIRSSELWNNKFDDQELREFFGEKYLNFPVPREFRQKGSGSGVIISTKGHILTNVHVVENAESITVTLSDNRSFKATLTGADPMTELAVIKIDGEDLPVAQLGNSDSLEIGQWVLAVGNPLELSSTVTAGIISAIGRDINIIADTYGVENFIQTDATINPGNSGGALVDLNGKVIGINTAIATQSGYSQGYGFAIPINLAKEIMKDLMQRGFVIRSYLGLSMQDVNEKIAKALGLKRPTGVFVDFVEEEGPARQAGLREKDVIVKIDNMIVNKGNYIQSVIAQKKPGDELLLTVIRKNRLLKIEATLGKRPTKEVRLSGLIRDRDFQNLGLEVENVSRRLAEEINLKQNEGVLVIEVARFSPAYDSGIQINDVILEIDDRAITSTTGFESMLSTLEKGHVYIIKMKRGDSIFHTFVESPEREE